jgi:hypothetical protein
MIRGHFIPMIWGHPKAMLTPAARRDVALTFASSLVGEYVPAGYVPCIHEIVGAVNVHFRTSLGAVEDVLPHLGATEIIGPDHSCRADDDGIQSFCDSLLDLDGRLRLRAIIVSPRAAWIERETLLNHLSLGRHGDGINGTCVDETADSGLLAGLEDVLSSNNVDSM